MKKFVDYYNSTANNQINEGIGDTIKALGLGAALTLAPLSVDADDARGIRNNNPGNIVKSRDAWEGATGDDGTFVKFTTAELGIRALGRNLRTYYNRDNIRTIQTILSKYTDDPIEKYMEFLEKRTGKKRDEDLDLFNKDGSIKNRANLKEVMKSIIRFENKNYEYPDATLENGINTIVVQTTQAAVSNIAAQQYKVLPGDNLSKIAKKHNIQVSDILKSNKIKDPGKIQIGSVLSIPARSK